MEQEKQEKRKTRELKQYKRILLVLVLVILVVGLIAYGSLIVLAYGKSLPGIKLMGNDIGLKTSDQISNYIKKISDANTQAEISINIDGQTITKKISDFSVEIDSQMTTKNVLNYGKSYEVLPNFEYFRALIDKKTAIKPVFLWEGDTLKILNSLPNKEKQAENASFEIKDGAVAIVPEKSGYKLDMDSFVKSIEGCLELRCPKGIIAKTKPVAAEITTAKLTTLIPQLNTVIQNGFVLIASEKNKKYSVDPKDLIFFLDTKKCTEQKTLWWNEANIADYLKNTISPKINIKGRPKQISTYDNSVISEGREGYGLQLDPSKTTVKQALIDGKKTAELSIGVTPVEEEYIGPGFTPNRVAGKYIDVNLTEQMLYTLEGDKLVASYRVSTGKWSMPTPVGDFVINNKDPRAYSAQYDLYMPYWMAFIGSSHGIHELPETSSGRKEGESSLGVPVSHGCIRLGVGAAGEVYNWAEVGTPVFVHR